MYTVAEVNLICLICLNLPSKEVFQCHRGHILCHKCFEKLSHCPQCRAAFGNPGIRNRSLETILESIKLPCQFSLEGCTALVFDEDLPAHVAICDYRPVNVCKLLGNTRCKFASSNFREVVEHIKLDHNGRDLKSTKLVLETELVRNCLRGAINSKFVSWSADVFDYLFLIYFVADEKDDSYFHAFYSATANHLESHSCVNPIEEWIVKPTPFKGNMLGFDGPLIRPNIKRIFENLKDFYFSVRIDTFPK